MPADRVLIDRHCLLLSWRVQAGIQGAAIRPGLKIFLKLAHGEVSTRGDLDHGLLMTRAFFLI